MAQKARKLREDVRTPKINAAPLQFFRWTLNFPQKKKRWSLNDSMNAFVGMHAVTCYCLQISNVGVTTVLPNVRAATPAFVKV